MKEIAEKLQEDLPQTKIAFLVYYFKYIDTALKNFKLELTLPDRKKSNRNKNPSFK